MTKTELAWAAGFFEGEGSIYIPTKSTRSIQMGLCQNGTEAGPPASLIRFQEAVGAGKIYRVAGNAGYRGVPYKWTCQRKVDTERVIKSLAPYFTKGGRF